MRIWALIGIGTLAMTAGAADNKETYDDPAKVPASFAVQGEYVGKTMGGEESKTIGVQIIALGDDKFEAVGYMGGLPGDGWNGEKPKRITSDLVDGSLKFTVERITAEVKDGVILITNPNDVRIAELTRVIRRSPTEGQQPPAGAAVLFDGSNADQFAGGKVSSDGLLMVGTQSKQKFGDCTVHVEFRTPYMPHARGQARGNSGVYLQARYEVQVLDSFGLEGKNNEAGGIYSISDPAVNMCYPPLSWQTYDIDFTAAKYNDAGEKVANARLTVRHNGVIVQNNVEVSKTTTAAPNKESAEPGPLYLQDHGNPVRFRNIWVAAK